MVGPEGERHERDRDQGGDEPGVADRSVPGEHRHDHGDDAGRGKELDVDLGVAEDPEQVLPQQ